MMYSITEAIYETYTTAAFIRVSPHHHHYGSWAGQSRRSSNPDARTGRPIGRLMTRGRKLAGHALTGFGAVLQAGGNRLIGAQPSGSC